MQKKIKIGVDEAGRWPWAGPVVAAALFFDSINPPSKSFIKKLDDSKKLSEKKRNELFTEIIEYSRWNKPSIYFWVGVVDSFIIDEINIRQANREAMRRALIEILRKIKPGSRKHIQVVIDGRDNYQFDELKTQPFYIVGWDGKVSEISAASIIAKVFRDKLMHSYASLYPDMNLEHHKWYGTKKHQEYLTDISKVTGLHRTSFLPIQRLLKIKWKKINK